MPGPAVRLRVMTMPTMTNVKKKVAMRLRLAGDMITSKVKQNINISTRRNGPSEPGNFPHKDTGKLQQSIQAEQPDGWSVTVGAYVDYALGLELGTSKVAARPFLRPTFNEMLPKLRGLFK